MKNPCDPIGNRTRDIPACSTVLKPPALRLISFSCMWEGNIYRSWGPPSLLKNWYRAFFLGVKPPERGVAKVKEKVDLYLHSLSGPSWAVLG